MRRRPLDEEKSEFLREVEGRIANLPKDFLDWMDRMPPWPEGADEIIGSHRSADESPIPVEGGAAD